MGHRPPQVFDVALKDTWLRNAILPPQRMTISGATRRYTIIANRLRNTAH